METRRRTAARTLLSRRRVLWLLLALLLLAAILAALHLVSRARCFTLTGDIVCRVETAQPLVALTFDDGPTDEGVGIALPALSERGAHATFFLIGQSVAERPQLVRDIVAGGHEVANHSLTHQRMVGRTSTFYDHEIAETHRLLLAAGAPPPSLFRPPYGKKLWGLPRAVERAGYRMVMIDAEEPSTTDPRLYAEQVVAQARPGSILLIHLMYGANRTARAALPMVLDGLQARGLRIVTVGELLAAQEEIP